MESISVMLLQAFHIRINFKATGHSFRALLPSVYCYLHWYLNNEPFYKHKAYCRERNIEKLNETSKLKPLSLPNKNLKHAAYIYWSKLLFQAKPAMEASRKQSAFTFTISKSHKQGLLCIIDKHSLHIIHQLYRLRAGKIWCCGFQKFLFFNPFL